MRATTLSLAILVFAVAAALAAAGAPITAADNELTGEERAAGWKLLFDGNTLDGWKTSALKPSKRAVEDACLNPHGCGDYMLVHETEWSDFVLAIDFKISKGCNSGVFFRTSPLTPRPGLDVGYNGIEIAIDDTAGAGFHDTGALYDLVKPSRNAMRLRGGERHGEWNHLVLTCERNRIAVELNGETVTRMDLEEWKEPNRRPDGTEHKFDVAYRDHPRKGFVGLQDHGADCWFKNLKLKPLRRAPGTPISKAEVLRILPIGDSLTEGGATGGYRYPLQDLLEAEGYKFRFLGSRSGPPDGAHDPHHDGHPGAEIAAFSRDDGAGRPRVRWKDYQPDIVLLMVGTDDPAKAVDPAGAPKGLAVLLDTILNDCPSTHVIVAQLPPLADAAAEQRVRRLNAAIPLLVKVRANVGALISSVDLRSALGLGDLEDGIHPNAEGYKKIAAAWRKAIGEVAR
jgi:lysophospholipase L1-like esterase